MRGPARFCSFVRFCGQEVRFCGIQLHPFTPHLQSMACTCGLAYADIFTHLRPSPRTSPFPLLRLASRTCGSAPEGVVLLFCKGDFHAVMLMLRGLKTFSEASGLTTNVGKSNIFSANMNMQHLKDLCEITGYQKGKLSFRYLGVLITSRKISVVDCEMLVDKLTVKVRGWGSRTLSYAGRVQLINSVLLHTHVYWASIFILPRAVLNRITSICRNYLWDGKVDTNRVPLIAWDFICRSKKEGGLGVTDCVSWSDAAIGKCIWNIAQKTYNLRVKWVNHLYIKEESAWDYEAPQDNN
uniref:Uncharacterized protein n=1 Tax=Nicotiana tabacum TaxID=4097 RepID=A0A1S3ZZL7_TOBAC|nr:PREDICTED: uncharacterized protein LOC107792115 [Nicotiana tabacum]